MFQSIVSAYHQFIEKNDLIAVALLRLLIVAVNDSKKANTQYDNNQYDTNDEYISYLINVMIERRQGYLCGKISPALRSRYKYEISILKVFLPQAITHKAMCNQITKIIEETNAEGLKDAGNIMRVVRKKYANRINDEMAIHFIYNYFKAKKS